MVVLPEFPESASETAQKPFLVVPGNFWSGKGKRATDGARTRDVLDHNQVLYQLSYGRHAFPEGYAPASDQATGSGTLVSGTYLLLFELSRG